jgi:hypothetical protein
MKTIQEKIAELETRTSSLEKKSGFQLPMEKATIEDIAEWIVIQPGVYDTVYLDVVEDIEGTLLHVYPALLSVSHYDILEALNKPTQVKVVFVFSKTVFKPTFKATLTYFKKSGKIKITKGRIRKAPKVPVVKTTPQEVAQLILDKGGLESLDRILRRKPITSLDQKKWYAKELLRVWTFNLRRRKDPDMPSRMSSAFKAAVIETLLNTMPVAIDQENGEFVYPK